MAKAKDALVRRDAAPRELRLSQLARRENGTVARSLVVRVRDERFEPMRDSTSGSRSREEREARADLRGFHTPAESAGQANVRAPAL